MSFHVVWPDGSPQRCFSPSTVVADHFEAGGSYALDDFVAKSRTALRAGSDRVEAKYGHACSSAAAQLADIERRAGAFEADAVVLVEGFGR